MDNDAALQECHLTPKPYLVTVVQVLTLAFAQVTWRCTRGTSVSLRGLCGGALGVGDWYLLWTIVLGLVGLGLYVCRHLAHVASPRTAFFCYLAYTSNSSLLVSVVWAPFGRWAIGSFLATFRSDVAYACNARISASAAKQPPDRGPSALQVGDGGAAAFSALVSAFSALQSDRLSTGCVCVTQEDGGQVGYVSLNDGPPVLARDIPQQTHPVPSSSSELDWFTVLDDALSSGCDLCAHRRVWAAVLLKDLVEFNKSVHAVTLIFPPRILFHPARWLVWMAFTVCVPAAVIPFFAYVWYALPLLLAVGFVGFVVFSLLVLMVMDGHTKLESQLSGPNGHRARQKSAQLEYVTFVITFKLVLPLALAVVIASVGTTCLLHFCQGAGYVEAVRLDVETRSLRAYLSAVHIGHYTLWDGLASL
jgi:hypothetical protein